MAQPLFDIAHLRAADLAGLPCIFCVGDLMFEIIRHVPELPEDGQTILFDRQDAILGGSTYNLGWYLSHLGLDPTLVAALPQDHENLIAAAFVDADLKRTALQSVAGPVDSLIALSDGRTHRSFYVKSKLPADLVDRLVAAVGPGIVVFAGSRHSDLQRAFMTILQDSAADMTVFAPSCAIFATDSDLAGKLAEASDLVAVNQREAMFIQEIFGVSDKKALADQLGGPLLVTLAGDGAELWRDGERIFIDSYTASADDVVGAGDAFLAGLLFVYAHGGALVDACYVGAVVASFVVESGSVRVKVTLDHLARKASDLGARRAIDTLESLELSAST